MATVRISGDTSGYIEFAAPAAAGSTILMAPATTGTIATREYVDHPATITLTDAATIAIDMSLGVDFIVTLGASRTLGAPTNASVGQSGTIYLVQDGTGSRTLAYNTVWKFEYGIVPTISTDANAVDILDYKVKDSTHIDCSLRRGFA